MWAGATKNQAAFLQMLSASEGTDIIPNSDDGYRALVGGTTFNSYADHPRIKIFIPRLNEYSSAAGRYQLLASYFDIYKSLLNLSDFSPDSQDRIALQQIKESLAAQDVIAGNFADAVAKCAHIWASLPGNLYNQGSHTMAFCQEAYRAAGGQLA